MSKFTDRTKNIDFRFNKSRWFVGINNPSHIASKVTMSVSSAAANIIFKGKPFISAKNISEPPIKKELQWWIINLDLRNEQSLILLPAQVIIQTNDSTKG